MKRTTILLPEGLRLRAAKKAARIGISLGELIRQSLAKTVEEKKLSRKEDPLFADPYVYTGPVPKDLSERHDDYLYGEEP